MGSFRCLYDEKVKKGKVGRRKLVRKCFDYELFRADVSLDVDVKNIHVQYVIFFIFDRVALSRAPESDTTDNHVLEITPEKIYNFPLLNGKKSVKWKTIKSKLLPKRNPHWASEKKFTP